jgi:phosphate transport system permease protein
MKNPYQVSGVEFQRQRSGASGLVPQIRDPQSEIRNRLKRRIIDRIAETLIRGFALLAIALICLIFVYVAREALPIFWDSSVGVAIRSMFAPPFTWQPVSASPRYSVIPLILGTFKVTFIAMIIAVPLALAAALYTAEFAPARLREWIKPTIELLAGIPSVVTGFFALIVLASVLQVAFGLEFRLNALTAGIALALAVIPIVYTVTEDALSAVPRLYREASLALGASKTQTAVRVVFPAAMPGIGAAIILGFGRAIGETMIVLMVSGNAAIMLLNPAVPARTLSATIAAELGEVVFGSGHYRVLFFLGTLLFLITSVLNRIGDRYKRRLREKLFGSA